MWSVSLQSSGGSGAARVLARLLGSLSLLLAASTSLLAQSSSELASTREWVKLKAADPTVRAMIRRDGPGSGDPCRSEDGTGPYDPLPCLEKEKEEWSAMLKVARADPGAPQIVKRTIPKIIEGLGAAEKEWRALPPAARDRRLAVRSELAKAVKESSGGVERGLQAVVDDPHRSGEARTTAKLALASSRRRGGFGGLGDLLGCLDCLCCCPENCPCCDSGRPGDVFHGQRGWPTR